MKKDQQLKSKDSSSIIQFIEINLETKVTMICINIVIPYKEILVGNVRKNNFVVTLLNQSWDIMGFIYKHCNGSFNDNYEMHFSKP